LHNKKKTTWVAVVLNIYEPITNENFDDKTAEQTVLYNNELAYFSPGYKLSKMIKKGFYINGSFNEALDRKEV